MPKADETRPLGYRIPEGAIEVEGVCRFSESEVACWDGFGKPAEDLAGRVRSALTPDEHDTYRGNLNVRFGRKNRIVVLRREQMPAMGGPGQTTIRRDLSVGPIGDDPAQGYGGGSINLPSESPDFAAKKPFVNHEARIMAFDPTARTTKARITVSESVPNPPDLPLAKGASVSFAGVRFTVAAIEKGVPHEGPILYGRPNRGEVWTVTITQDGKASRPATFSAYSSGALYRDAQGRIVTREDYDKWMREAQAKGGLVDFSKNPYRPVQVTGMSDAAGRMRVIMDADPSQVKRLRLFGSYQRSVDLTGIPLDPK